MHIVGRFHKVRQIGADIGPPEVLDRKWSRLMPYPCDEWWQAPDGSWHPTVRGGSGFYRQDGNYDLMGIPVRHLGAPLNTNLNSAYTYGSAGACVGWGMLPNLDGKTVQAVNIMISGRTSTPAAMEIEIRDSVGTYASKPGSTLIQSASFTPGSTAYQWYNCAISQALTFGTEYWICAVDADGAAGAYWGVYDHVSSTNIKEWSIGFAGGVSTNGFSTMTGRGTRMPQVVVEYTDGTVWGHCLYSGATSPGSLTADRGCYTKADFFPTGAKVFGLGVSQTFFGHTFPTTGTNTFKIWEGATGPSGSPAASGTVAIYVQQATAPSGVGLSTPYSITASNAHRFVVATTTASTVPQYSHCGNASPPAGVLKAFPWGGNMYWAEANGTIDWSNDATGRFPLASVLVEDFVSAAGGGMLISPGMSGGMRG